MAHISHEHFVKQYVAAEMLFFIANPSLCYLLSDYVQSASIFVRHSRAGIQSSGTKLGPRLRGDDSPMVLYDSFVLSVYYVYTVWSWLSFIRNQNVSYKIFMKNAG